MKTFKYCYVVQFKISSWKPQNDQEFNKKKIIISHRIFPTNYIHRLSNFFHRKYSNLLHHRSDILFTNFFPWLLRIPSLFYHKSLLSFDSLIYGSKFLSDDSNHISCYKVKIMKITLHAVSNTVNLLIIISSVSIQKSLFFVESKGIFTYFLSDSTLQLAAPRKFIPSFVMKKEAKE